MSRPRFRRVDRDQLYVLPPSVREWLPPGHPALFVVDLLAELDLSGFVARYRSTLDRGRPAYHPEVMVGICLYAAMCAVNSSRRIARQLVVDAGFRVVAANEQPDHSTISRFLIRHAEALEALFAEVVLLGGEAGVLDSTVVALDSTPLASDASMQRNVTLGRLREQFRDWNRDVDDNDAAESAAEQERGESSGPIPDMAEESSSRAWIRARLDERADEPDDHPLNTTDPDSALQRRKGGGWVQGYNVHAGASCGGLVVAVEVTANPTDVSMLKPMVAQIAEAVEQVTGEVPCVVVADAGYWSTDVVETINNDPAQPDVLVPPHRKRPDTPPPALPQPDLEAHTQALTAHQATVAAERERRTAVIERVVNGELLLREAAALLGMSVPRVGSLKLEWIAAGGAHGMSAGQHRRPSLPRPPTRAARAQHAMETRLASPAGRSIYRLRAGSIEPIFGDIKTNRRITRLLRRGIDKARTDVKLIMTGHNLTILHRAALQTS